MLDDDTLTTLSNVEMGDVEARVLLLLGMG